MTTWNTILIDAIVDVETLPTVDAWRTGDTDRLDFAISGGEDWMPTGGRTPLRLDVDGKPVRDPDTGAFITDDAKATPDHQMWCSGESKWRRNEIGAWAIEWTREHPGIEVQWDQHWDDDDGGREESVYRDGALVREESKKDGMVPMDLESDVANIRAGLAVQVGLDPEFAARLTALLDALVPPRTAPCEECNGTGERTYNADPERDSFDGPVTIDCETCAGTGQVTP